MFRGGDKGVLPVIFLRAEKLNSARHLRDFCERLSTITQEQDVRQWRYGDIVAKLRDQNDGIGVHLRYDDLKETCRLPEVILKRIAGCGRRPDDGYTGLDLLSRGA